MKNIEIITLTIGFLFFGCNQADKKTTSETGNKITISTSDKEQIHNLIRQTFEWVDSEDAISSFPVKTDSQDSVTIVGVDLEIHKQALAKLRESNLFASEFVDNYNRIVLTLDEGLKNGEYGQWFVGEYPPFPFANGFVPWCLCQCECSTESFEIEVIKIDDNARLLKLKRGRESSWVDFTIRVLKENDKWKIAYLEGFDFEQSIRKDGQF